MQKTAVFTGVLLAVLASAAPAVDTDALTGTSLTAPRNPTGDAVGADSLYFKKHDEPNTLYGLPQVRGSKPVTGQLPPAVPVPRRPVQSRHGPGRHLHL
jgi:hypothetical protein